MLRLLALLALVTPALADPSPERLVEEIAELREDVGGGVASDRADFADALRRVAGAEEGQEGHAVVADDAYAQAGLNDRFPPPQHPNSRAPVPIDGYLRGFPADWPRSAPPRGPARAEHGPGSRDPRRHPPASAPRPPRPHSNKVMLREAAFELDRIAHGFEMAELLGEADELRDTADKLRKSARRSDVPKQTARKNERKLDQSHQKMERQLQKVAEMQRHLEEAKRAIGREKREWAGRVQAAERQMQEREKEFRQQAGRRPEQPRDSNQAERPPMLPPRGVHGGPTDPPKPHN